MAGAALVIAALAMVGANSLPPRLQDGVVIAFFLLAGSFLLLSPWLRRLCRGPVCLLLSPWLHRSQSKAAEEYPHFPGALKEHCRLLGLSFRNLADEAGISYLAVCFFVTFPGFIPRPEFLEGLRKALMLPEEYFQQGGSYGLECSYARLYRYDCLGYGKVFAWARIRELSQEELDEVLSRVEDLRREDLRKEGKVS